MKACNLYSEQTHTRNTTGDILMQGSVLYEYNIIFICHVTSPTQPIDIFLTKQPCDWLLMHVLVRVQYEYPISVTWSTSTVHGDAALRVH